MAAEKAETPTPIAASSDEDGLSTTDGLTHGQYMIAGAIAGVAEHICMFPVDTVKTRMQAFVLQPGTMGAYDGVISTVRHIARTEGPLRFFRGVSTMAMGAGPAHAVYFSTYELCKEKFGGNLPGHHPLATGLAGATATTVADGVMCPADVVKQRMQLNIRHFATSYVCAKTVLREEGVGAFWAGYPTTLVMNIPFTVVHFSVYESMKKFLHMDDEAEEGMSVHLVAGGTAGAVAAAITNPLDVVKTRLQTQGEITGQQTYHGMRHAIKSIKRKEGLAGFARGLRPRVMFQIPAAAICWTTYEQVKRFFKEQ